MVTISYTLSLVDNLTSNVRIIENVSNERFFVSECDLIHVGKVSTRFEYFASGFASLSELALIQVELGAEFDSESNGDIFRPAFR